MMDQRHEELAKKVVDAFKTLLSDSAREQISEANYDELALLIREAIAEELGAAADQVEAVARRLRAEVEKPELGL